MFTHSARKLLFTIIACAVITVSGRVAFAVESQTVTRTAEEQTRELRERSARGANSMGNEIRNDADRARDSINRTYDSARDGLDRAYDNTRDNLDRTMDNYRENRDMETRRDLSQERLQYQNAQNMGIIKDTMPTIPYRSNLTSSERDQIHRAERKYSENLTEYRQQQSELRSELNRAEPGSREAKNLEEKLWDVERKISKEQVDFRDNMRKYE